MKSKSKDKRARNAGLGLVALVATVIGVGVLRSRKGPKCEIVEVAVYRGFCYRIEKCPLAESQDFVAIILAQTIGDITYATDTRDTLATFDAARSFIHTAIDRQLGPTLKATFMGANAG